MVKLPPMLKLSADYAIKFLLSMPALFLILGCSEKRMCSEDIDYPDRHLSLEKDPDKIQRLQEIEATREQWEVEHGQVDTGNKNGTID